MLLTIRRRISLTSALGKSSFTLWRVITSFSLLGLRIKGVWICLSLLTLPSIRLERCMTGGTAVPHELEVPDFLVKGLKLMGPARSESFAKDVTTLESI